MLSEHINPETKRKRIPIAKSGCVLAVLIFLLSACASTSGQFPATPSPTPLPIPTVTSPNGYRPLQTFDTVAGVTVQYYYVKPSLEKPAAVIAFGPTIPELVEIRPGADQDFTSFIQETLTGATGTDGMISILGFDINDASATEPKSIKIDPKRPVEFLFGVLSNNPTGGWSDVEGPAADDVREAYKLIRRKDGGLLFVDLYHFNTLLQMGGQPTLNGGLIGLTFASRIAALPFIVKMPIYQNGKQAIETNPFDYNRFDPRILRYDPTRQGAEAVRDWVLFSRPGPALPSFRVAP